MVEEAVEGVRFGRYAVLAVDVVDVEGVRRAVFMEFWYTGVADEAGD